MGDQVGVAVSGTLYYAPFKEFVRIRNLPISMLDKASLFATLCRINTLYMIARAGSGHIGSSFSSLDIMSWLQLNELRTPPEGDSTSPHDIFFSSKGHDAPGLYSTLIGMGKLDFEFIHKLRRLGGLPGHPDISTPNIVTNTGSLGMGVSKAKGMIFANRLLKRFGNIFVLTGDGELQEGQFWESLISAANHKLHELIVIIDHNKLQSDTLVSKVSDLGNLETKLAAFGWHVSRCNGNDIAAFSRVLKFAKEIIDKPKVIIADTIKGKGVSFMEHTSIDSDVEFYKFHSGAPSDEAYVKAAQELINNANDKLRTINSASLALENVIRPTAVVSKNPQRLVKAYSKALLDQARKNPKIVALDADLVLDTGLIPFQKEFPERFIECGIAEQDMVSQAGGMALKGLLPIVHSFACFLSARPNEQIYNNATEKTKIIYVGSLAGLLPGGPGHSHQALRDVSALRSIPGFRVLEPCTEDEVEMAVNYCINVNHENVYLRLVSVPVDIPFQLPKGYKLTYGKGVPITEGKDAIIFSSGPVMLTEAYKAAHVLKDEGVQLCVVNLPWTTDVDLPWLIEITSGIPVLITLDNHYVGGALGTTVSCAMAESQCLGSRMVIRLGVDELPSCGSNAEVLAAHRLNSNTIAQRVRRAVTS